MRPQDIVLLLKIAALGKDRDWYKKDLAAQLNISNSEVSESLNRSLIGGLIEEDKKTINKEAVLEFLVYGIKYVFPAQPGSLVRGLPTGYSAPILKDEFIIDDPLVWEAEGHKTKGVAITPLYHTVPEACKSDPKLYDLLALTDALRVGERNEQVIKLLTKKIFGVEHISLDI